MADDAKPLPTEHLISDDPSLPEDVRAELREAEAASDWVDSWLEQNGQALEASLVEVRASLARGEYSARSIAEIIADGRKRHAG